MTLSKQSKIKGILYYMYFYKTKYHCYYIYTKLEMAIYQLVTYKNTRIAGIIDDLVISDKITFNDLYNQDQANPLNVLANDIIHTLKTK